MITPGFSKDELNNLYGLSCIENFLLYILKKEKYLYKYLFFQSFLPFRIIIDSFIREKVQFAYFDKIMRIQDLAGKYGLIDLHTINSLDFEFINKYEYICVMVKPEYIKSKYKIALWREDHYILLSQLNKNHFYYLNDTPRDVGLISFAELKSIFAGQIVAFDIRHNITDELIKQFFNLFIYNLDFDKREFIINIDDFVTARDILGIHRILRRRVYEFCSMYTDVEFLIPYLNTLDKHYTSLEYMRLRNNVDFKNINIMLLDVYKEDIVKMNDILRKLEEIR